MNTINQVKKLLEAAEMEVDGPESARVSVEAEEHLRHLAVLLAQALVESQEALRAEVSDCAHGDCGGIGLYNWSDQDGEEMLCEGHNFKHFYEHGGYPAIDTRIASASALKLKALTKAIEL